MTTLLACYRNKPAVVDYTVGGALAGSLYKFSLGPKGMVSGGVFGGILGTFAGALIVPMIKLSDKQMSEFYATTHEYFKYKDRNLHASPLVSSAYFFYSILYTKFICEGLPMSMADLRFETNVIE